MYSEITPYRAILALVFQIMENRLLLLEYIFLILENKPSKLDRRYITFGRYTAVFWIYVSSFWKTSAYFWALFLSFWYANNELLQKYFCDLTGSKNRVKKEYASRDFVKRSALQIGRGNRGDI